MESIQELLNLTGKSAIVTGGAKGIGLGIVARLAEAGAAVLIADMDEASATKSAQDLQAKGWKVEAIKTDVSSEDDVKAMIATCVEKFGSLDILVNNAGIYPSEPIAAMSAKISNASYTSIYEVFS